ncbi:GNAT family protein [Halanaerocella petrolearia]
MAGRIYGEQVMLREYREDDFEDMRQWVNDYQIVDYLSDIFLYPQSEKQTKEFLDMAMSDDWKGFIIADRETEEYIGQIDFADLDHKNGYGELGIVIGKPSKLNKGLGTETLELFLAFGFEELRLNRIELVCYEYNQRAQHVYEKVGFIKEGVRRKKIYRNGQYYDEYLYGILKEEWETF